MNLIGILSPASRDVINNYQSASPVDFSVFGCNLAFFSSNVPSDHALSHLDHQTTITVRLGAFQIIYNEAIGTSEMVFPIIMEDPSLLGGFKPYLRLCSDPMRSSTARSFLKSLGNSFHQMELTFHLQFQNLETPLYNGYSQVLEGLSSSGY
jgi:hypothetical protein